MKIATIISQIDLGSIALPQFQRGYVWNRNQVRSLMFSLYRKYPVGSLLVWVTKAENAYVRGDSVVTMGAVTVCRSITPINSMLSPVPMYSRRIESFLD